MATTTAVPQVIIGPTGVIVPAESAILAGRTQDINTAFGGALNPALTSPQGQLASSDTAIIGYVNDFFLFLANMFDPAYAAGRFQDALARIYFIERNPSQPTVTQCVCTGLAGVVIPAGALAQAEDGNLYVCTETGTIATTGTVTLPFACQSVGPIPCPAGTLNEIYQSVPGWDTIANATDGVLGTYTETRPAFETRRALSVAKNSLGGLPSILGAVLAVPNVIDAFVTENDTSAFVTVGGYSLAPNSIYVAVLGGDSLAVATAIWSRKAPGCAYNGNTTVQVLDTSPGYVPPYPTYSVSYEIPVPLDILFAVTIVNSSLVPANAASLIQGAIVGAFAGLDGGAPAKIATEVLASRFYAPIAALGAWAQIVSVEIGSINAPAAVFTGSIAGNVLSVSASTSGALAVGQAISDTTGDLVAGTVISAISTDSSGNPVYTVNNTQTVGSEAMMAVVPDLFKVAVNLNQIPVVAAANVTVTLG